jgi:hypothetical protein
VAIVGGGPAGAFSAIHLLAQARQRGRRIRVVVFERNCQPRDKSRDGSLADYAGCPHCAGGVSPGLVQALKALGVSLPPEVVQASISSITVQGNWKSIILSVPRDREMFSVYRGTLPCGQRQVQGFDPMMLGIAVDSGARLIGSRVQSVRYNDTGRVELEYVAHGVAARLTADFVVFAGGVNDRPMKAGATPTVRSLLQQLQPAYEPPRLRKALIVELEALTSAGREMEGELHFIESSAEHLHLDMCSLLSKRGYITATLVGKSVDESISHEQNLRVIKDFLALPQIHRALPPHIQPTIRCICNPGLVLGTAVKPYGQRVAAVGDMATSRQYKDGILSAHNMAAGLANVVFDQGIDQKSLEKGYGPVIARFKRDNRYASMIFFLYRWFFTSPLLSRVIYQTFASEKKTKPEHERDFKRIFWAISSGDGAYRDIAWSMVRPATVWAILRGGIYVTVRNGLGEWLFGLDWRGIGRVPTAVSRRELSAKRATLLPHQTWASPAGPAPEFECMYKVHIRAAPENARALLAQLGEEARPYLNPRGVKIRTVRGEPSTPGSVIQYTIFSGFISFSIEQQPTVDNNVVVYKVCGGFADGGVFVFQIEPLATGDCDLTIYLAFDYVRGNKFFSRIYWRLFKLLFPEFIHDVIWNHALCELKHEAEATAPLAWEVRL